MYLLFITCACITINRDRQTLATGQSTAFKAKIYGPLDTFHCSDLPDLKN